MLAHIHIMKTAGQTVCDVLRDSFGANHCDLRGGDLATAEDVSLARWLYPHLQSIGGHSIRPRGDLLDVSGIQFFVFLRDPVERTLSHYQFERLRNGRDIDFLPWLRQNANYQTKILSQTTDPAAAIRVLQERIGFVGLVEAFQQSLQMLGTWSGHALVMDYKSRNIARSRAVKNEIRSDSRLMRVLRQSTEADQAVYDFAVNTLFPQQVATFGAATTPSTCPRLRPLHRWWSTAKRNLLYKPAAKTLLRLRTSA